MSTVTQKAFKLSSADIREVYALLRSYIDGASLPLPSIDVLDELKTSAQQSLNASDQLNAKWCVALHRDNRYAMCGRVGLLKHGLRSQQLRLSNLAQ